MSYARTRFGLASNGGLATALVVGPNVLPHDPHKSNCYAYGYRDQSAPFPKPDARGGELICAASTSIDPILGNESIYVTLCETDERGENVFTLWTA